MSRVGSSRRRWTLRRSSIVSRFSRSGPARMIRRRHGVLDGQVDADPADRRHGVRRVADAEQSRQRPFASGGSTATVKSLTSSQLFSSETRSLKNGAIAAISSRNDSMPRLRISSNAALGDEEAALPVIAAVDHDEDPALIEPAERLLRISRRRGRAASRARPSARRRPRPGGRPDPGPSSAARPCRTSARRGPRAVLPGLSRARRRPARPSRSRSVTSACIFSWNVG